MVRKKKYPSLPKNLSGAVDEFSRVFGISGISARRDSFVESIRRNHGTPAVMNISPGRALIWTKEGGIRKIIVWIRDGGAAERELIRLWRSQPETRLVEQRGINLVPAFYARNVEEILQGADDD